MNNENNTLNKKIKKANKSKIYLSKKPKYSPKAVIVTITIFIAVHVGLYMFKESNNIATEVMASTTEVIVEPTVCETTTELTTETIIVEPTVELTTESILPIKKSYNTSVKSNLTEEEIEYILDETYLEGTGWAFKYIEDTYNVNAIFALSVAETETTFGQYGVAESHNNAFGLTSSSGEFMYFDSLANSVLYFGAYIPRVHWNNNRYYVGDIAPVYCDYEWGEKVEDSLEHWYEVTYQMRN